jgi:hypothetical protein
MMLVAYFDETGHSSDAAQKFVGIAGFVAPALNWEFFEANWKAAQKLFLSGVRPAQAIQRIPSAA